MIIVLGGVSHTGKTYLAQRLLEKYKIPYLSLDHLKMGLIRGKVPCEFTLDDDDMTIANKMWPLVEGIIATNIENHQNLIIEGCYLPPDKVRSIKDNYGSSVTESYIVFTAEYIQENFEGQILRHRNVIENRVHQENRSIEAFIAEHQNMRAQCQHNSIKYFDVDSDYNETIQKLLHYIDGQLTAITYTN
ncbi:MAG: zeta toxin family protein [Cyclobacteriaceae bacterium]